MSSPVVAITGATGWLGLRLTRALLQGLPDAPSFLSDMRNRQIRCLVQHGQDLAKLRSISDSIEVFEGDLTDPGSVTEFLRGAEGATIFHAAGVIHPRHFVSEFYAVNEYGTRHLVQAAKNAKARRFIYVSSNSPMGCNPDSNHLFDETSPYNPYMNYGKSKKAAEEIVNAASGDLETVIVRAPWFYGPDQPARQTLFFSMIKNGKMPLLGNGDNRRSMVYIDNLCQGLMLCDQTEHAKGQTYWIADQRPYLTREIVDTIENLMEREFGMAVAHRRLRLPRVVGDIAWAADKAIQGIGLYHQKIHVLSEMNKHIACSVDKARRELRYDPKVDLEEGMRRSLQWVINQGIDI